MKSSASIPKLTDRRIIAAFQKIAEFKAPKELSIQLYGIKGPSNPAEAEQYISDHSFIIQHAHIAYEDIRVSFNRRPASSDPTAFPFYDQIDFQTDRDVYGDRKVDETPPLERAKIFQIATEQFYLGGEFRASFSEGDGASSRLESVHLSILERLENAATSQLQENQKHAAQLDALLAQRFSDLEERARSDKTKLDADFAEKQQRLEAREKELEDRKKTLDDRDNTHVRREIRRDLNKILSERLEKWGRSATSRRGEAFVHLGFWLTFAGAAFLLWYFGAQWAELFRTNPTWGNPQAVLAFAKQTALSITLIGSVLYYVRWLIRQYQRNTDSEDEIRRYLIDFERASWVVETALEWKKDQATQIPDSLLSAISRQLFSLDKAQHEFDQSPADILASTLLGTASKVNLNTGVAQIEIDGKKLQKADLPKS